FLPNHRKSIRHARKLSTVDAPYFPRYLFIVLDLMRDRWRSVNGTFGVSSLLMQGGRPQPVPSGVIETLIASADAEGIPQFNPQMTPGQPVRMVAGPFAEQLAVF